MKMKKLELERRTIMTPLLAMTESEKEGVNTMVKRAFKRFDSDGSGTLDFSEFVRCLQDTELGFTEEQAQPRKALARP